MEQGKDRGMNRRDFTKMLALGVGAATLPGCSLWAGGQSARRLPVGHTGITWGFSADNAITAIQDTGSLGYHSFESFGNVIEAWEERGGIGQLLEAANIRLQGAYCNASLTNPAQRETTIANMIRWGNLIKKYGGSIVVIGPNNVQRATYNFAENRANIVSALNDIGMALMDIGMVGALHPHTSTCIETGEETRAVFESADTRYVKFCPDVGQLQKAGSDPVPLVRDFVSIVHHVHMKDYDGGPDFEGYAPLGRGQVQVEELANILEASSSNAHIMVELDPNPGNRPVPIPVRETAQISKEFLQGIRYPFRV